MLTLPGARATPPLYDWGIWQQQSQTRLINSSQFGSVELNLAGIPAASVNVPTTGISYPNLFANTFVPAGGVYSPIQNNQYLGVSLLFTYSVQQGTLFGISDVASIGFGGLAYRYRLVVTDYLGNEHSLTPYGNDVNPGFPQDDNTFTINGQGELVFGAPQVGHDSQGQFYYLPAGTVMIEFDSLQSNGGDGIRFYVGSPVPEPGVATMFGFGVGCALFLRLVHRRRFGKAATG